MIVRPSETSDLDKSNKVFGRNVAGLWGEEECQLRRVIYCSFLKNKFNDEDRDSVASNMFHSSIQQGTEGDRESTEVLLTKRNSKTEVHDIEYKSEEPQSLS